MAEASTLEPDDARKQPTHPAHLAHHFPSLRQQFDACKLGMWVFLLTEVLFFSGLFCLYAVYRANHPEVFNYAHRFLDKQLGALNTIVLIFSSLTAAWAVRCAQLNQRRGLILCLALTLACAGVFLGVKFVEYHHKWQHGMLWAGWFDSEKVQEAADHLSQADPGHPDELGGPPLQRDVGIFFSIYFAMTGLHGIHVLAGIGVITWILVRAIRGEFSSEYFAPVDFTALYWHLVDLIWIYLFPLLYLIH